MTISRRNFVRAAVGGLAAAALPRYAFGMEAAFDRNARIGGLDFGVQTFSFNGLPGGDARIPTIIKCMHQVGVTACGIQSGHVEPPGRTETGWWIADRNLPGMRESRERARQWRLNVPSSYYTDLRSRFEAAGCRIDYFGMNFNETFTDAEREAELKAAKALGVKACYASIRLDECARLVPFVQAHQVRIAMHNHNNIHDPQEFGTAESLEKALAMSEYFMVSLDIGHFTAGNNDSIAFIRKHHDRILNVHLRDRKKNNGPNTRFGEGDAPLAEVMRLIRDEKYPIDCFVEYEYGTLRTPVDEVNACFDYCRSVLT
jgi:sugar phosphate isomerase/epimerase